jgi:glycoside hydrolase-like protein
VKRALALLAVLCATLIAACGGGVKHTGPAPLVSTQTVTHTSTTATSTTVTQTSTSATTTTVQLTPPTSALKCPPGDITMQCKLATLPPPKQFNLTPGQQYGIDFGWSAVSASGAHAIGAKFGASYLSLDPSKNWTRSLVDAYHALGLKTVAVWETSANRAEGTRADGSADARAAIAQATALGMPANRVIEFAVDCNCSTFAITAYFEGVHDVLGNRAGIYGGYNQVGAMHAAGLVGDENWQTYAWSNNQWQPASVAPLEQYLNGNVFDNDRSLAPLYGQWPAKVTPPENPHHYGWLPNTRRTFKITQEVSGGPLHFKIRARERSAIQHWDKWGCRNPVRRNKCIDMRTHLQLLEGRLNHIAHHTPNLKHKVRKPRWGAQHFHAKDGHRTSLGGADQQFRHRLSKKNHGVVAHW